MILQSNPQLELALEFVRNTNQSVFLTGKAGTGKTTFLHQVKADGTKRMAVVAPTGVAAINAGGMTIHSLFQLPLGIFVPGVPRTDGGQQRRFKREKIQLIRSLDLLVIDEISMVRADLLDAVDDVLRRFRDPRRPFGGVQLLMIGDLHQLPPVVKNEDWNVLSPYYETPYFFGSRALRQTGYVSIELRHIYRQSDSNFIALLNKVRNNVLDDDSLRQLNSRFIADFRPPPHEPYITLTATNAAAQELNVASLKRLPAPLRTFTANIKGEFPPSAYPTEEKLEFKKDAQVMFIKNDQQPERRYFNGKIGRITRIDDERILVRCPGDHSDIEVIPSQWQNVRYTLNEETRQIDEQILGTFTQYPLKLAWAITIHKSQGLTFDRAIIDAEAAFAHGQVYVALSRCKSFEGIVLRSRIHGSCVITDPAVRQFTVDVEQRAPNEAQLQQAKREYQVSTLNDLFRFDAVRRALATLRSTCEQHAKSLAPLAIEQMQAWRERIESLLFHVIEKFAPQLATYLVQDVMPADNEVLQGRIKRASVYFLEKITGLLQEADTLSLGCENQEVGETLASQLQSIQLALFVKRACFAACEQGFTTEAYNRALTNAEFDFNRTFTEDSCDSRTVPGGTPHPELYRQLLAWREKRADQEGKPTFDVIPNASLRELVTRLPTSDAQLREIAGIGKRRRKRYGDEIRELIRKYRAAQNRQDESPRESPEPVAPARGPSRTSETKQLSFDLFRAGKSLDEIAAERHLVRSTIEGHLAHFIGLGELDIHTVLPPETVSEIQQFLVAHPHAKSAEAKAHFGAKYGYGELNMVIRYVQSQSLRDEATREPDTAPKE